MQCLSLSGLIWAKKTGIFILGTLTIMTVDWDLIIIILEILKKISNIILCNTYNALYYYVRIPEGFNTNISHQLFDYIITFVSVVKLSEKGIVRAL